MGTLVAGYLIVWFAVVLYVARLGRQQRRLHEQFESLQSAWQGRENCNDYAVGIELEGSDNQPFSAAQYEVLWKVIDALRARYPVTAIAGHCHVAPERKTDPGLFFDWPALAGRYPALGPASEEAT